MIYSYLCIIVITLRLLTGEVGRQVEGTRSLGSNFDLQVRAAEYTQSAVLAQGVWCTRQPSQADAWLTVRLGELR
jgi:hypothetical protein